MIKKTLKIIGVIFLGIVMGFNLFTMALSGLGLRERLNWLPGAFLTVDSGSMEPLLYEGDLLFVWETPYEQLQTGDMVTFHSNNELVTHQIVRKEDDRFVTRGIANNKEDLPIGPEEYCAKVTYVVPKAGRLFELFTDPLKLILMTVFILALFYGPSLIVRLTGVLTGEENRPFRIRPMRIMGAGTAISLLCITPFMTAAKYTANINEYASVTAGVTYFTSNYLSEGTGNRYYIEGWNGLGYGISLYIQNYENDLLFNKKGYNLNYQIEFNLLAQSPDGKETYSTDYDVFLYCDGEDTVEHENAAGKYGPYFIEGSDEKRDDDYFEIALVTKDEVTLSPGTKVRFQVIASTIGNNDFNRQLKGDFTFTVTDAKSFLFNYGPVIKDGSALISYSIKTTQVEGPFTRDVKITWDSSKVYLNVYEPTAANAIANKAEYSDGKGTGEGYLILPLSAYSNVNLQFFKYDPDTEVVPEDFSCIDTSLLPAGSAD